MPPDNNMQQTAVRAAADAGRQAAQEPSVENTMTAKEQIRSAISSFGRAYKSKDLDKLVGVYSESLIKDRAGAASEGKPQTTQRIQQVFEDFDTDLEVEVAEIHVSGDLAFVRGEFTVTLTPHASQTPTAINRRYLEIWRNEAGCWRVTRTMDNEACRLP